MIDRVVAGVRLAARFDLGMLRLVVPLRLAAAVVLPVVVGVALGDVGLGAAAAIGAFICGVADTGESMPIRMRVMGTTAVALGVATLLGGWISDSIVVVILVCIPVAAMCAFASAFGPNAGLTGMLTLVIFIIYAGNAIDVAGAAEQALAVFLGCLVQVLFAVAGWPLRRLPGARGQVADAWRSLSVLMAGEPADIFDPQLPVTLIHATAGVGQCGARGRSGAWLTGLAQSAEAIRLPIASVSARRAELVMSGHSDGAEYRALTDFVEATSVFARAVARSLVWTPRAHSLPSHVERVSAAAAVASHWLPDQVELVLREVRNAAELFERPLPLGRHAELGYRVDWGTGKLIASARANWHLPSPVMRHTLRMMTAIPVAWLVGLAFLPAHQYWVPMTLAWVAKPGYGVTVARVFARTIGTIIGICVIGALALVFGTSTTTLIVICAVSAYALFALLPVNYATAIIFVTSLVMALFVLAGEALLGTLIERIVGTVLGALLAIIFAQLGRQPSSRALPARLAVVADHTKTLCDTIAAGEDVDVRNSDVVAARQQAAEAIEESRLEGGHPAIDPDRASHVLNGLLLCIFFIAAQEQHRRNVGTVPEFDNRGVDTDLDLIVTRLREVDAGTYHFQRPWQPVEITRNTELGSARAATGRCLKYLEVGST